jgi:hypothetical protein
MIATLLTALLLLMPLAEAQLEPAPWTDTWCQERWGGDGYGPLPQTAIPRQL